MGRILTTMMLATALAFAVAGRPGTALADTPSLCTREAGNITLRVSGVQSSSGLITAVLYGDNPDDFLVRGRRLQRVRVPATGGTTELCMSVEEPGTYAIGLYHDENGNRRFDKNWVGIPAEGFGFSLNPGIGLGPPDLIEAAFEAGQQGVVLDIEMNYIGLTF